MKSQPRRPRARPSPQHSPQHSPQRLQRLKRRALGLSGRVKSRHSTASSRMGPSCNQPHRACHDARHDDPRSSSSRHQTPDTREPTHPPTPRLRTLSSQSTRCVSVRFPAVCRSGVVGSLLVPFKIYATTARDLRPTRPGETRPRTSHRDIARNNSSKLQQLGKHVTVNVTTAAPTQRLQLD